MNELLNIKDLVIHYETDDGIAEAVRGINLTIGEGMSVGLVGETGAGKTTLAKGIIGLIPDPPGRVKQGSIFFEGKDLLEASELEMRKIRGQHISMIFQDPMTSLNPVMTVGEQIAEVVRSHNDFTREQVKQRVNEMFELVGIPPERSEEYPHQFSGGMRQRVVIAMALACNPKLLIADEPTTALDVTIQAQVLDMIRNLKEKFNTALLLITHDLGVVAHNCDYVAIVYAGQVVEYGTIHDIFKGFRHPYTEGLFGSIPSLTVDVDRLNPIEGLMPDPMNLPSGCVFHERCKYATGYCVQHTPEMKTVGAEHTVRCFIEQGLVSRERGLHEQK